MEHKCHQAVFCEQCAAHDVISSLQAMCIHAQYNQLQYILQPRPLSSSHVAYGRYAFLFLHGTNPHSLLRYCPSTYTASLLYSPAHYHSFGTLSYAVAATSGPISV